MSESALTTRAIFMAVRDMGQRWLESKRSDLEAWTERFST